MTPPVMPERMPERPAQKYIQAIQAVQAKIVELPDGDPQRVRGEALIEQLKHRIPQATEWQKEKDVQARVTDQEEARKVPEGLAFAHGAAESMSLGMGPPIARMLARKYGGPESESNMAEFQDHAAGEDASVWGNVAGSLPHLLGGPIMGLVKGSQRRAAMEAAKLARAQGTHPLGKQALTNAQLREQLMRQQLAKGAAGPAPKGPVQLTDKLGAQRMAQTRGVEGIPATGGSGGASMGGNQPTIQAIENLLGRASRGASPQPPPVDPTMAYLQRLIQERIARGGM